MRGGREVRPGRLERIYAFRPRAHQDRVGTVLAAFGVTDRQSVNLGCLRVNQGAHGNSLSGTNSWPENSRGRPGRGQARAAPRLQLVVHAGLLDPRTTSNGSRQ